MGGQGVMLTERKESREVEAGCLLLQFVSGLENLLHYAPSVLMSVQFKLTLTHLPEFLAGTDQAIFVAVSTRFNLMNCLVLYHRSRSFHYGHYGRRMEEITGQPD